MLIKSSWLNSGLELALLTDCQYWQKLERNWRQWKNVKPVGGVKGRLTVVYEVVEEEGGKIEE